MKMTRVFFCDSRSFRYLARVPAPSSLQAGARLADLRGRIAIFALLGVLGGSSTSTAQNVLPNGDFSSDTFWWFNNYGPVGDFSWSPIDSLALPGSGSVEVSRTSECPSGLCEFRIESCVPVFPGQRYYFEGSLYVPTADDGMGSFGVIFFSSPGCLGAPVSPFYSTDAACSWGCSLGTGAWHHNAALSWATEGFLSPSDAVAATFSVESFSRPGEAPSRVLFDRLYLGTRPRLDWVALGDSYASGEGAGSYGATDSNANNCHRSESVWSGPQPGGGAANGVFSNASRRLVACSGAETLEFRLPQAFKAGAVPPQLSDPFLPVADAVSLTIGGNDLGFGTIIRKCMLNFVGGTDCTDPEYTPWGASGPSLIQWVQWNFERLQGPVNEYGSLSWAFEQLSQEAPYASVLVFGYPRLFPAGTVADCHGITPVEQAFWNAVSDDLNALLCNRAQERGFHFVPVATLFDGHAACQPLGIDWINDFVSTEWQESFHPNKRGQAAYAQALRSYLPDGGSSGRIPTVWELPPQSCPAPSMRWAEPRQNATTSNSAGLLFVEASVPGCSALQYGVSAGLTVALDGSGFEPGSAVAIQLNDSTGSIHSLGQLTATPEGNLQGSVELPAALNQGDAVLIEAIGTNPDSGVRYLQSGYSVGPGPAVDGDLDSIPDLCDLCPLTPDPLQDDADGDKVGDLCDPCPYDSENDFDADGECGDVDVCPFDVENDPDGDGYCSELDTCPFYANSEPPIACIFGSQYELQGLAEWGVTAP